MSFCYNESRNLIDYFAVCGLDIQSGLESESNEIYNDGITKAPLERSYKCKILNHFPENLPWNPFDEDAVTQLCLPKGLVFQKHYSKPVFHPFIITREDGSRIYGGALKFFELIEDESICNAMQSLQTMYDVEFSVSKNSSTTLYSSLSNPNHSSSNMIKIHQRSSSTSISDLQRNHLYSVTSSGGENVNYSKKSSSYHHHHHQQQQQHHQQYSSSKSTSTTPITAKSTRHIDSQYNSLSPFGNSNDQSFQNENENHNYLHQYQYQNNIKSNGNNTPRLNNIINISNANITTNGNDLSYNNLSSPFTTSKVTSSHHYNILKDSLYASKCICIISQYPFNKPFSKILHTLYNMVEQTDLLGINLESHLYNLIYEIPAPINGKLLKFHLGCKAVTLHMPDFMSNKFDLPLFDYDLFECFRLLGVSNMIHLYITGLLEHQILLYSKNYDSLMLVAESLTSLFFPFTWLKPYVPIVPASNLHFIEAPVPYIMGFHHRDIDKEFFKQSQRCFVDIDSGTVTCPEGLPDFPDKNKFIKDINEVIIYFTDKLTKYKQLNRIKSDHYIRQHSNVSDSNKYCENNGSHKNSTLLDENNASTFEILQNSQAFARITELARKAGAITSDEDYKVDSLTGRLNFSLKETASPIKNVEPSPVKFDALTTEDTDIENFIQNPSFVNNLNKENISVVEVKIQSAQEESKEQTNSSPVIKIDEEELLQMQFTRCVRELFLQRFVQMFASYEKYVIVPNLENGQIETWWSNREYSGNFDSKMFLIEQPSPRLPFLSHFISTQMFVSFIDLKIISIIDSQKEPDPNVKIFDHRIKQYKESDPNINMNIYELKADQQKALFDINDIENAIIKEMSQEEIIAPKAHAIHRNNHEINETSLILSNNSSNKKENKYLFENLNQSLLKIDDELIKNAYNEIKMKKEFLAKKREKFNSPQLKLSLDKLPKREKKSRKPSGQSRSHSARKDPNGVPIVNIQSTESIQPTNGTEKPKTELNPIFIQSLLKESKLKTKRMLVEKMPDLRANFDKGEAHISGIEENMLIASLCDLIERIWGHGLHNKPGKSALWNHLSNYKKLIQYLHPNSQIDTKTASPTLMWCLMKKKASTSNSNSLYNQIFIDKTNKSIMNNIADNNYINTNNKQVKCSSGSTTMPRKRFTPNESPTLQLAKSSNSNNSSPLMSSSRNIQLSDNSYHSSNSLLNQLNQNQRQLHKRAQSATNNENNSNNHFASNGCYFPPLKNDLLGDLARIDKLTEVKTEIGMARAFVRLSLEKKLLADHLRQLLSEGELLRALYKRNAFLRHEEEREQFIYHLQSLNVVDYFCFTNYFRLIHTDYSVLIVPSKKFNSSTTSANPYIKLYGSLGESGVFLIPKNCFEFVISSNINLGPLTTLVIGHDNAGITPKWMIEYIYVRNEITGHIHKFPCGRWLGKGIDDDSLERLLIAEPLSYNETYDLQNVQTHSPYNNNSILRSRSPTIVRTEEKSKLQSPAIQEMLGNTINTLVKYFEKPESERGSLTNIMCGENGLVNSIDNIFSFGYKSYKLFKRLYVWDFFEKVANEFETYLYSTNNMSHNQKYLNMSPSQQNVNNFLIEKYISAIRSINSTSSNYGKDGKFQILICLACRDSFLADWFQLICKSNTTTQMYDEYSFLRNYELNKFCIKILPITNQFNFKLENSLTMGINY